ncbi:MAG TPA: universal stress protein [Phycisphaerae bacterium]|nr:universal stress protein [Phycisphaerae bacterium]HNU45901.1 universal stress protein [Phycisphaerae bacterium]
MALRFANVLYPTDFSEFSLHALPHAKLLAETYEAAFHCLHVVDDAAQYWSTMGPESVPMGPIPQEVVEAARLRMTGFAQQHLADWKAPVRTEVVVGRPFVEIVGYARRHEVDLIVMATHGRGAISHILLGSTTEKVVRKAPCAVLVVRTAVGAFTMP